MRYAVTTGSNSSCLFLLATSIYFTKVTSITLFSDCNKYTY